MTKIKISTPYRLGTRRFVVWTTTSVYKPEAQVIELKSKDKESKSQELNLAA